MKKLSRRKIMFISALTGLLAVMLIYWRSSQIGGPKVDMVLMVNMVKAGQPVKRADVITKKMPQNFAENALFDIDLVAGKIAVYDLTPGHPVLKDDVSDKPMKDGLYQGEVSARVPVDNITSGGALPGDYVDVSVIYKTANGQAAGPATPLLKHKRVIALINAGGQKIESQSTANAAGGFNMTPSGAYAAVAADLAVSPMERDQLINAGKVYLSKAPWESADQPQAIPGPVQAPVNIPPQNVTPQNPEPTNKTVVQPTPQPTR